ncbi:MAG: hypothetical protein WC862_02220 [Patescibacteria group bacterium]
MEERLKQSILQTLAYFDIFDHPLTKEELRRWHYGVAFQLLYSDFLMWLDTMTKAGLFGCKHGYYFLLGREEIVAQRERRIQLVEKKMKIAIRGIKKIRWTPFVRAVFVCNTLSGGYTTEESDIDVFVIVKNGRLWLARLQATLILILSGLRRNKKKSKDRICLSFYAADNYLDLSTVSIDKPDIYLMYWISQLVPVYDPDNLHNDISKKNQWIKEYLSNALQPYDLLSKWRVDDSRLSGAVKRMFEKMWAGASGNFLESQAKGVQRAKMKMNFGSVKDEPDTRVVISDSMLKFHENDRRKEYKERWLSICRRHNV